MKIRKRLLALLVTFAMAVTMLPTTAIAEVGSNGVTRGTERLASVTDALQILRLVVGLPSQLSNCEISYNSARITGGATPGVQDALQILRYLVSLPNMLDGRIPLPANSGWRLRTPPADRAPDENNDEDVEASVPCNGGGTVDAAVPDTRDVPAVTDVPDTQVMPGTDASAIPTQTREPNPPVSEPTATSVSEVTRNPDYTASFTIEIPTRPSDTSWSQLRTDCCTGFCRACGGERCFIVNCPWAKNQCVCSGTETGTTYSEPTPSEPPCLTTRPTPSARPDPTPVIPDTFDFQLVGFGIWPSGLCCCDTWNNGSKSVQVAESLEELKAITPLIRGYNATSANVEDYDLCFESGVAIVNHTTYSSGMISSLVNSVERNGDILTIRRITEAPQHITTTDIGQRTTVIMVSREMYEGVTEIRVVSEGFTFCTMKEYTWGDMTYEDCDGTCFDRRNAWSAALIRRSSQPLVISGVRCKFVCAACPCCWVRGFCGTCRLCEELRITNTPPSCGLPACNGCGRVVVEGQLGGWAACRMADCFRCESPCACVPPTKTLLICNHEVCVCTTIMR
jgi:hypothetical protein